MQTRRLVASFEDFHSYLTQSAGKSWSCEVMVINTLRAGLRDIRTWISA